jgi:hypothetical protein
MAAKNVGGLGVLGVGGYATYTMLSLFLCAGPEAAGRKGAVGDSLEDG